MGKIWDLGKNLNQDEVLQILRLMSSRDRQASPVMFYVRGQHIHQGRLRRYVTRHPGVVEQLRNGTIPPDDVISAVTYRLVSPDRWLSGMKDHHASENETLLWSIRNYVLCSLDSKVWSWDSTSCWSTDSSAAVEYKLHNDLHAPYFDILKSVTQGDKPELDGRALDQLFDMIPRFVKAHPPYFLATFIAMSEGIRVHGQVELSQILVRYTTELALIYFGPNHPLYKLLRHICARPVRGGIPLTATPMKLLISIFEDRLGLNNGITLYTSVPYLAHRLMARDLVVDTFKKYFGQMMPESLRSTALDSIPVNPSSEIDTSFKLGWLNSNNIQPESRAAVLGLCGRNSATQNQSNYGLQDSIGLARKQLEVTLWYGSINPATRMALTEEFWSMIVQWMPEREQKMSLRSLQSD
ncbi:hypothetical protein JX266_001862 [Neoarthrinium moseri]|nr:hypothetical protein JX266_001862 [Neoarthrinium moseri]